MINIHVDNDLNAFIWNAEDWFALRNKYHIIGNLIGARCSAAKNSKILALPSQLLPEEVTLLVENKISKLVKLKDAHSCSNPMGREKYEKYKHEIKEQQTIAYKQEKENKIRIMIDTIVSNKRASSKGEEIITKEDVLQKELSKIEPLSDDHILVHRFLEDPWSEFEDFDPNLWTYPQSDRDKLRFAVFKDLWLKKYYVTNGNKFAGDFLVYGGDPSKFHAKFIVLCKQHGEIFKANEIAMHARVASNTKKTVVLASIDDSCVVQYHSLYWANIVM